jgi:pilus assembly protein CpaE
MKAPYSYRELLANLHRLDADLLFRSLAKHSSGVYVMSQTDYLDEGRTLSGDDAKDVVTFLARHFDFVIIDGVRDFSDVALAALDKANHIMLTMTQDIPALKNAHRCLRIFHRLGYTDERIHLVLNRYRNAGSLTTEAVGDALARPVSGTISNDFPSVSAAVNEGRVLVDSHPSSRVAKDITTLVGLYHQVEAPKRRSLFARWSKP